MLIGRFFSLAGMLYAVGMMLTACDVNDDNEAWEPEPVEQQRLVIAMFSPDGLGDRGYNDQILYGLLTAQKERSDLAMLFETPQDMEEAELIFRNWLDSKQVTVPCMFILASFEYEPMLQRALDEGLGDMTDKTILLFETGTEFSHPQVYSFKINMYGASYLAGACAAAMGITAPLVMLGSSSDREICASADGFNDGYSQATGKKADLGYFAVDWTGYAMSQRAYEIMPELCREHDFIFPVAGGTSLGIYRYLREHPEGPLVAGMDIDQSAFSNNIAGSIVKRTDRLVRDGITQWLNTPEGEARHTEFGLESGYIDWQLSELFVSYSASVEKSREKATECERKYNER